VRTIGFVRVKRVYIFSIHKRKISIGDSWICCVDAVRGRGVSLIIGSREGATKSRDKIDNVGAD
jgi:hypothetical protein